VRWLGPGRKEDFETEKEALETRNTTLYKSFCLEMPLEDP